MLPDKVKIGGTVYDVQKVNGPIVVSRRECNGKIFFDLAKIELLNNDETGDQAREYILWHEILHGIARDRQIDLGEQEEDIVEAFAMGIYALVKDNPYLPGMVKS